MAQRRESVRLELVDSGFSSGMVKNAAATGLLERALKSLDGTTVNIHQSLSESATGVDNFNQSAKNADGSINQLTGRLRVLGEVAAILAPTIAPLGGVAIAGIGGLANQMGIAAVAGGVLIGAMQGVGDALGAMNKAQLEPTEKNLKKAKDALQALSPAARDFAKEAFALKPALVALRDLGAEELMPGLTESLNNLEDLGPRVAQIMQGFAGVLGDIADDSTASLASERYADFFEFISTEGPKTLQELATTVGDLAHGFSELWEAFAPLNSDFSSWLMDVADGFDGWASGLSSTEGFQEFIDYIRETGPQVADTLGAMFSAIVQLVQASAPLGGPVLAGIEAFSNAVATIADSDLGTPIMAGVTALALLNRTMAITASLSKVSLSSGMFAGLGAASKGVKGQAGSIKADIAAMSDRLVVFGSNADKAGAAAERMKSRLATGAGLAGLAVAATGAADGLGLTNTASLALMGSWGGAPGIAIGAAAGALLDLRAAGQGAAAAIDGLDAAIQSGDPGVLTEQIAAAKAELADLADVDFSSLSDIFENGAFTFSDFMGGDNLDAKREKIDAATKALEDMAWAEKSAAIQAKGAALEFLAATGANVDLAKWSGESTEQIKAQADALTETRQQADETARSFVGLGDSLTDGKVSLREWIKEMASSADALNNFTTNSRTAAKRGLDDGLIRSLQTAGEEGARRMRQLANGTKGSIDEANAAFRKGEKAIERYNNYKVPPKKVTADVSRAMQSFREVDQYLSSLDGKTATTYVNTVRSITGPQGAAVFSQQAFGDFKDRHNPEIAAGGSMRIWAEPETRGESYIPHANDSRRPRAKSILEQTASMFGGEVQWFAGGGTTGPWSGPGRPTASSMTGGVKLPDQMWQLEAAIVSLTGVAEAQTEALRDATSKTEEWSAKMADVASATTSGFNTGLFAKDSNPWAAGAGSGALFNLNKDIAGLNDRGGMQSQLAGMGLSGDALAALLGEGSNTDIASLISTGQVGQYADLYAQRSALQGSVGSAAGQQAYGQQYAAADRAAQMSLGELQQVNVNLAGLTGRLTAMETALSGVPERAGLVFGDALRNQVTEGHRNRINGGGRR
jgi:hypothetical protein